MKRFFRLKLVIPAILLICFLFFLFDGLSSSQSQGELLHDGSSCSSKLGPNQESDLRKVLSYKFLPQADKYIPDLFSGSETVPNMPAFVTAFDSSHFIEGSQLISNLRPLMEKYTGIPLIVFDLGLREDHKEQLQSIPRCRVRTFPFEQFPDYVHWMKGYAWKPLAIQLAIKEHPFVFWMDTSVRFKTTDLDGVFEQARKQGVLASDGYQSLAMRTSLRTFQFLQEDACTFRDMNEFEATFIIIHADDFVKKHFLKPWISCALSLGCMVPPDAEPRMGTNKYLDCAYKGEPVYFLCHRFDQSILSILLTRIYHSTGLASHRLSHSFYEFCKAGDELWFLPDFLNELVINNRMTCF